MNNLPLRRSGMVSVNEGSHRFTCHPHVYPQVEWTIAAITRQPRASPHFGRYSFSVLLRVEGWVGLIGWSQTEGFTRPQTVTHPSTNRAPSCSNFVDRDQRDTTKPSRHLKTCSYRRDTIVLDWTAQFSSVKSLFRTCETHFIFWLKVRAL